MKTTEILKNLDSIEVAGNGEQYQFNKLVAAKLREYRAILLDFANKTDPVGPSQYKEEAGCNRCKLCGATGKRNQENVSHQPNCPWIRSLMLFRQDDERNQ